jgi:hypothetical protein
MAKFFSVIKPGSTEWACAFAQLPAPEQDVFYSPDFSALCQSTLNSADEVLCAAMIDTDQVVLYPFIKRDLARVTGVEKLSGTYDMTGLYGRGGIVGSPGGLQCLSEFHAATADYCRESRIICGFDRFHPLLENHERVPLSRTTVSNVGGFVVIDMRADVDEITSRYKHSVRKDLRKAERNGIKCFSEQNTHHLGEFLSIYYATMVRNEATDFYYFPESYFLSLEQTLQGSFTFFYAEAGGEIISCELALHCGKYCHSFLGGTRREALPLCPNTLLKHEMVLFFKERGCEYFLLGGGAVPDDGIFNYKRAFALNGVLPSYVGGTVWDAAAYGALREQLVADGVPIAEKRFQFYDVH